MGPGLHKPGQPHRLVTRPKVNGTPCLADGVLPVQVRSHIPKFAQASAAKKLQYGVPSKHGCHVRPPYPAIRLNGVRQKDMKSFVDAK